MDFKKILRRMVKTAAKHQPVAGHRVYCEIWNSGQRITWGSNHETHFNDPRYMKNDDAVGMHAEVSALLRAENTPMTMRGAVALVARARKTERGGQFVAGLAKPCPGCMRALSDYGVAEVYWTENQETPDDEVVVGFEEIKEKT